MTLPADPENLQPTRNPGFRPGLMAVLLAALAGCCFATGEDEPVSLADKNGRTIRVEIRGADEEKVHVIRLPDRKSFSLDRATLSPRSVEKVAAWEERNKKVPEKGAPTEICSFKFSKNGIDYVIHVKLPKGPIVSATNYQGIVIRFDREGHDDAGSLIMKIDVESDDRSQAGLRNDYMKEREAQRKNLTPNELAKAGEVAPPVLVDFGEFKGIKLPRKREREWIRYRISNEKLRVDVFLSGHEGAPFNQSNIEDILRTLEVTKRRSRR